MIPPQAIRLIKHFEGCILHPYNDIIGIPTIFYGHVILPDEVINPPYTKEMADFYLEKDLRKFAHGISKLVTAPLTDNQLSALLSWTFNLGLGTLQHSTVRMCINRKQYKTAADHMLLYCRAAGRPIKGLIARRKIESNLFLKA